MVKFNYALAQEDALELITEFGQTIDVTHVEKAAYDPVLGTSSSQVVTTSSCEVVTIPVSSNMLPAFDDSFREAHTQGKARFFYMAQLGLTFEPINGDLITFEGKVWEMVGITPLNPAGLNVMFSFGAKPSNLATLPT